MTISVFSFAAVCEHAYSLAQKLDPNSEGISVLQFRTGLMSVIKVSSSSLVVSWFLYTHILYIVRPWFISAKR